MMMGWFVVALLVDLFTLGQLIAHARKKQVLSLGRARRDTAAAQDGKTFVSLRKFSHLDVFREITNSFLFRSN